MLAQPDTGSVIGSEPDSSRIANPSLNILIGVALLLPLLYFAFTTRLLPAVATLNYSFSDWNLLSEPEFVGSANYTHLLEDARFRGAVGYTLALAVVRVLAVAIIPPFIGALAGNQGKLGRILHRLIFALIGALVAPAALSALWVVFWGTLWGRQPSPLLEALGTPPPFGTPNGAPAVVALLDAIITGTIALAVGGSAFMAVARGRRVRSDGSPGAGVWLLMIFTALLSISETFVIPYITTNGGPGNATNTLSLQMFRIGFMNFQIGLASAQAVLLLVGAVIVTFLIWLVLVGFQLRLSYTPEESTYGSGGQVVLSLPLLVLAALPIVGLVLWGHWLVSNNGGYARALETLNLNDGLRTTLIVPLQTIWVIQVPITYLAGLSLGFIRPFGRGFSNFLFLLLLLMVCAPVEALMFAWYNSAREASILNTVLPFSLPWFVSGLSLIVFKMFFDGARQKYFEARAAGRSNGEALMQTVLLPALPIALVVGAVLSFASAHTLLWPLIAVTNRDLFTLPVQLVTMRNQFSADASLMIGAAVYYIGVIAAAAVPVFALLQIFVLDRLAILAGKPDESMAAMVKDTKPAEDPLAVIPSSGSSVLPGQVVGRLPDDDPFMRR